MATAIERFGLRLDPPQGWQVSVFRRPAQPGEVTHPVLHACTRPMPDDRGDFGTGVVDDLGPEDVFVALLEYGTDVADRGLFDKQGMPRLAPSQFSPDRLQRHIPGRSASQHFFSTGGRAFCLFTVLGSHARRMATVPKAVELVRGLQILDVATVRSQSLAHRGGTP
jgi:hypothetical protein